ncbi:hypothetical protein B0H14DRAFT_3122117 [Mycena olivaceomarginata]|uniref:Uncharacterized protein n=1 Tax=Mycena albidolilacea TaxID=1033008 RepID=A0AAD6ZXE9_9AGAR|nr:hypothetical protein DFH08DRAFT_872905 [Mycena albidolilacea]KAJ7905464.1 hypothetical protein B0H14DRAFT_3122117 [Mycena olivaceomarginata]
MCKWRQVRHHYTAEGCGHIWEIPNEEIKCASIQCIFSDYHPRTCVGQRCRQSCWQYHQFPEQHTRTIAAKCPNCARRG